MKNSPIRILLVVIGIIITSFFLFPFQFKFALFINTKQILALMGLTTLGINMAEGNGIGSGYVQKEFAQLSCFALIVSFVGLVSVTYNETPDYTYAGYIMSFWVWMGAAYAVYSVIKRIHKTCSIPLITNYLLAVCVIQCILAIWMDLSPSLKNFIDTYIEQDQEFLNSARVQRIYGIGASLDTAGTRFSAVLILVAHNILTLQNTTLRKLTPYYLISFAIIIVIGNMIARTTSVGVILGAVYLFFGSQWKNGGLFSNNSKRIWTWVIIALVVAIPSSIYLYNTNEIIHEHIRFAFEGFFSLIENGRWEVRSNNQLAEMIVWPESLKTWIIGDGYFNNPNATDPYYTGEFNSHFYMDTDVGYLRFIFYFGITGLIAFSFFLWKACQICYNRFHGVTLLFYLILITNFIIWFKVSTDIFLIFSLFLCINKDENEEYMKAISLEKTEESI